MDHNERVTRVFENREAPLLVGPLEKPLARSTASSVQTETETTTTMTLIIIRLIGRELRKRHRVAHVMRRVQGLRGCANEGDRENAKGLSSAARCRARAESQVRGAEES